MLLLSNKRITVDFSKCQQCGTCKSVCPTNSISLRLREDGLSDVVVDYDSCIGCGKCVRSCPSTMRSSLGDYRGALQNKNYFFAYNSDKDIRHKSSSGGAARTLIIESLLNGVVDGVYSLRKSESYPFVEGAFYTKENIPTYDSLPNSVYHSVMIGRNISEVTKCKRLMIVGTICQLKSLRVVLKGKYEELISVCIFCKQQKTLNSTRFLAKAMGTSIPKDKNFLYQYRGNGWHGIVKLNDKSLPYHRAAQLPFGRRLWSVPGCNVCGDPFGLEYGADLSLMDPWMIREANDLGETLVTALTTKGEELLKNCANLTTERKEYKDIEPALGLKDIERKRALVPYFLGEKCNKQVARAGKMEQFQRRYLQAIAMGLPKMPFIVYRIMCKIPDLRNIILK